MLNKQLSDVWVDVIKSAAELTAFTTTRHARFKYYNY